MTISRRYLSTTLGLCNPVLEIIGSISFALITFIYAFTVSSFFNLRIFILQDRVTYDFVIHQNIISEYGDQILIVVGTFVWFMSFLRGGKTKVLVCTIYGISVVLAVFSVIDSLLLIMVLMSVPIIAGALIYNNFAPKKLQILNWTGNLYLSYLWIISFIIGVLSLIFSLALLFPFSIQTTRSLHDYAYEIFLMLSAFSPVFMTLLVFCIPVKVILKEISKLVSRWRNTQQYEQIDKEDLVSVDPNSSINKRINTAVRLMNGAYKTKKKMLTFRTKFILIALSMMLSIALAAIPHLPIVNTDDSIIGVDTHYYVTWTSNLTISAQEGPLELVEKAFVVNRGDRPLSLLVIFFFVNLFGPPEDTSHVIDNNLPLVLAPLMVLAIYFMTRQMTSSDRTSILAAFLTAVSFHILIGIYAGFFAHWIALIIGYVSLGFLFRYLKKHKKLDVAIFSIGIIGLMFAHVYTWTIFVLFIGLFLLMMLKMRYYVKRSIFMLLMILLSSVVIDISKSVLMDSSMAVEQDLRFVSEFIIEINKLEERWDILVDSTQRFLGGLFANPIILLLGLYWLVKCNYKEPTNVLLLLLLSTAIISFFIPTDWLIQARLFYNIPFQIPAAIALVMLIGKDTDQRKNQQQQQRQEQQQDELESSMYNSRMVVFVACIWLISMSIKALSNLPPYV